MTVETASRAGSDAAVPSVTVDADGITIDGTPRTLLCASLFYFRLPRQEWRRRLEQVRDSGYHCVDVYLPWNFHELAPGEWSFDGRGDAAAFLDLAAEVGLMVIARPGPYICSEWDGGGLPAWLGLDPDLRVRQNDAAFLTHVRRWFDQVMPMLAARQHDAGGPVVMVQLENELDFFDCSDRAGYLGALRDMALDHGITVPLVACAGQGDLQGATGEVDGVIPAFNFYPADDSPDIEPEVRHYAELAHGLGLPLLVTETNRSHRTLRRLLASGASLIAPYLQSSGWNFGFTPATGNWGRPGSFMSHGYDFGGYVSSTGAARAEYREAQVLARVLDTLGLRLARSRPADPATVVRLSAEFPTSSAPSALDLSGGGRLVAVPNLGDEAGSATAHLPDGDVTFSVAGGAAPLVLLDVPLAEWGVDATMALASADLVAVAAEAGRLELTFASDVPVTVVLHGLHDAVAPSGGTVTNVGDRATVSLPAPGPGRPEQTLVVGSDGSGRHVEVHVRARTTVDTASATEPDAGERGTREDAAAPDVVVSQVNVRAGRPQPPVTYAPGAAPPLEALGVYRGRGTYAATADLTGVSQLLVVGACDVLDLRVGGVCLPSSATFGATQSVDVTAAQGNTAITAVVEIWGHANFDDARLPALRLGGLRGLGSVWAVRDARDITALWRVVPEGQWAGSPAPIRSLGGWSSTRVGAPITYERDLGLDQLVDHVLRLEGLREPALVRVDSGATRAVTAEDPWLLMPAGTGSRVTVTVPHDPSRRPLRPQLLQVTPVHGWSCAVEPDTVLTRYAARLDEDGAVVDLPLTLEPGTELWLDVDVPALPDGHVIAVDGEDLRVTAWLGGECLGRLWTGPGRPPFTGGDPDRLWLPAAWTTHASRLTLAVRGTRGFDPSTLNAIRLAPALG
ncbi:beta-galactosidase [Terrabacter sp. MAHUQ-38]|uniref:beta-galactosidase n=1 Tax=unclassified Terrabacter TaxID=2630222 RepID=UPI001CAA7543